MNYGNLSSPIYFDKKSSVCCNLIKINKIANDKFLKKHSREKLKGIFIYIDANKIYGINKKILHSVTIKDKEFYSSYPCINDVSYIRCLNKCSISNNNIFCAKKFERAICSYRMSRINWIWEVIHLANLDDANIKIWSKLCEDKTTGQLNVWKRFVWYKNELASYVIIFIEKYEKSRLKMLEFLTAYPVFNRRTEDQFNADYQEFISKNKKSGSPVRVRISPSTLGR